MKSILRAFGVALLALLAFLMTAVPFAVEQFALRKFTHGLAYPIVYGLVFGALNAFAPDAMARLRRWVRLPGVVRRFVRYLLGCWMFFAIVAGFMFVALDDSAFARVTLLVALVLVAVWLVSTRAGRHALSLARIGMGSLSDRIGASSVVVVGLAGVVGVLVAMLAMGEGFRATLATTGGTDTAIILRGGSQAETNSVITRDQTPLIESLDGIARGEDGRALASAELSQVVNLPSKSDGTDTNVQFRGVGPKAWLVRPRLKIVEGRRFNPGLREIVVGRGAQRQFAGLDLGRRIKLGSQEWTVVGVFESNDSHESELWTDVDVLGPAFQRQAFQSVTVKLDGKGGFSRLKAALAADPRLKLDVSTTRDYYARQSERLTKLINALGKVIGVIMALGAVFGALNSMYAAVSGRAREIATMRALGFRGVPVVTAVMLETMLLALAGGTIGALLAWLVFNGHTVSTLGNNFSQVVFQFRVTPALLWTGLKWALGIGLVGGLFPALRAARMEVTDALRAQ